MAPDSVNKKLGAFCERCGGKLDRSKKPHGRPPKLCSKCGSREGRMVSHAVKVAEEQQIPLWPLNRRGRTIEARYAAWRATEYGREIYRLFRRFAYEALAVRPRFSHKAIVERIRWYVEIEAESPDGFHPNDHYTSRMARELVEEDARFADLFNLRKLRSP